MVKTSSTKVEEEKLNPCHSSHKRNYRFRQVQIIADVDRSEIVQTRKLKILILEGLDCDELESLKRRYCFGKEVVKCGLREEKRHTGRGWGMWGLGLGCGGLELRMMTLEVWIGSLSQH